MNAAARVGEQPLRVDGGEDLGLDPVPRNDSPAERRRAALEWVVMLVNHARRPIAHTDLTGLIMRYWRVSHDTAFRYIVDLIDERPPRIAWCRTAPGHLAPARGEVPPHQGSDQPGGAP